MSTQNTNTKTKTNPETNPERQNALIYFSNRENKATVLKDAKYKATILSYTLIQDEKTPRLNLKMTLNGIAYTKTVFDIEFLALCRQLQVLTDTPTANPFDTIEKAISDKEEFPIWIKTVTVETQRGWAERQNWLYKEPVVAPVAEKAEEPAVKPLTAEQKKILDAMKKIG